MEITPHTIRKYMFRCIYLAKKSELAKPKVGSLVISEENDVLGEGYRTFIPYTSLLLHSERAAIDDALSNSHNLKGKTLVTTLEPCARTSRPQILCSCSELIVKSGIETVVIALQDVSPLMHNGKGIKYLKEHNVNVLIYNDLNEIILLELMDRPYRRGYLYKLH